MAEEDLEGLIARLYFELTAPPEVTDVVTGSAAMAASIGPAALEFEDERALRRRQLAFLLLRPMLAEGAMDISDVLDRLGPDERLQLSELLDGQTIGEVLGLS